MDLRNNKIDKADDLVGYFAKMVPTIKVLHLKGNPAVRRVNMYRKEMTRQLPCLNYLDERPISDIERILADAFVKGGKEEEDRARDEYKAN